jgi:hypothetical protein
MSPNPNGRQPGSDGKLAEAGAFLTVAEGGAGITASPTMEKRSLEPVDERDTGGGSIYPVSLSCVEAAQYSLDTGSRGYD